jgi:predicted Zn finger-like uncharacterized protein
VFAARTSVEILLHERIRRPTLIVTCESCKSKYNLDDAKITGRGAKITCPKCKNVFVVYARTEPPPTSPGWEQPRSRGLADAVKAQDARRADAGPGAGSPTASPGGTAPRSMPGHAPTPPLGGPTSAPAAKVVGNVPPHASVPGSTAKAPVAAPASKPAAPEAGNPWADEEPTRIGESIKEEESAHEVHRPDARAAPTRTDPAEVASRAATLDFRKVGVTTWKVKVKIGLIYDFSDVRTLRKYIQDGRVTSSDVVSWDGKTWKSIGDIPDLDAFFVETWDQLAARKEDAPTPPPSAPVAVAPRAEEPPTPARNAGEPNQFQDPFADLKRKQKDRLEQRRTAATVPLPAKKPDAPPTPDRTPMLAGVVVLLLLLGGAAWWFNGPGAPVAATPPHPTPPHPAAPSGAATSPEDVRKRLDEEIARAMIRQPAGTGTDGTTGGAGVAPYDAAADKGTPGRPLGMPTDGTLTPVRPDNVPVGAVARQPRGASQPTSSAMSVGDATAADHEAIGDDAASSKDWAGAVAAYGKAVALDGKNVKLLTKLGEAQYEAGDLGAAQPTLQKAAQLGSKDAPKYLGHILRVQGDLSGANTQYQLYLKGSPRDAAEIEKLVAQMSGG